MEASITCGICQDVMYRAVALQPCLHSFCGACYSEWMNVKGDCPECRADVRVVSRNHTLNGIIEDFFKTNPSKARSPDEMARMTAADKVGTEPLRVARSGQRKRRRQADDDDSDDDSGDDDDDPQAPAAPPAESLSEYAARVRAEAQQRGLSRCECCRRGRLASLLQTLGDHCPLTFPESAMGNSYERNALRGALCKALEPLCCRTPILSRVQAWMHAV
uniref:RING-type domain-containing protein n=1 Tax=Prymnesium polylepis TaxID=72548 RepID=A0A7S4HCC8_9EUKA|mmetsp:Transcript_10465/g.25927  ORF Transcript_10465/g.25927 Transcript_10465/m.25927 type:complete len:219 (+) Transcript_10465:1-657(+)